MFFYTSWLDLKLWNMITIPWDIELINNRLGDRFGRTVDGKQKFRIIWSDDQIEYRRVWHVNGIQLIYPQVREVRKYNYAPERWILERWIPHNNPEISTVDGGSYEPVWVFQDGKGEPLRPIYPAAEIICLAAENGPAQTVKELEESEDKKFDREVEYFEEELKEKGGNFGNQSDAFVSPMFMDSTKQKMRTE